MKEILEGKGLNAYLCSRREIGIPSMAEGFQEILSGNPNSTSDIRLVPKVMDKAM